MDKATTALAVFATVVVLGALAVIANGFVTLRDYHAWWQLNQDKRIFEWLRQPSAKKRSRVTFVILCVWLLLLLVLSWWVFPSSA